MRTSIWTLLCVESLFFFANPKLVEARGAPRGSGIVNIQSTYLDRSNGRTSVIQGAGTVFAVAPSAASQRQRLFIITASHVSRGSVSGLFVNGSDISAKIIGRQTDIAADIDLIEINAGSDEILRPVGFWDPESRRIVGLMPELKDAVSNQLIQATDSVPFGKKDRAAFVAIPGWDVNGRPRSLTRAQIDDQQHMVNRSSVSFLGARAGETGISRLPLTDEKFSYLQVVPGMSGEALWDTVSCPRDIPEGRVSVFYLRTPTHAIGFDRGNGNFCYEVSGITTRYLRDLTGSFFASDSQIASLVEFYLAHSEQRQNAPARADQWVMRNCLLYRVYGNGSSEVNLAQTNSAVGGHLSGDGGGHLSGDGGENVRGGDQCANIDSNVVASLLPGGIWWVDKAHPQGKATFALDYPNIGPIAADSNSVLLARNLKLHSSAGAPVIVGTEFDFIRGLLKKYSDSFIGSVSKLNSREPILRSIAQPNQLKVQGSALLRINSNSIAFSLNYARPSDVTDELIEFFLDRHGNLLNSSGLPVQSYTGTIEVRGKRGTLFTVDLQSLFFIESTTLQAADDIIFQSSVSPAIALQESELEQLRMEGPTLKVKEAGSSLFRFYSFMKMPTD